MTGDLAVEAEAVRRQVEAQDAWAKHYPRLAGFRGVDASIAKAVEYLNRVRFDEVGLLARQADDIFNGDFASHTVEERIVAGWVLYYMQQVEAQKRGVA